MELDTGEAVLGCMSPVPSGRDQMTITIVATDEAWESMLAGPLISTTCPPDMIFAFRWRDSGSGCEGIGRRRFYVCLTCRVISMTVVYDTL